jgi:hypothetical protein
MDALTQKTADLKLDLQSSAHRWLIAMRNNDGAASIVQKARSAIANRLLPAARNSDEPCSCARRSGRNRCRDRLARRYIWRGHAVSDDVGRVTGKQPEHQTDYEDARHRKSCDEAACCSFRILRGAAGIVSITSVVGHGDLLPFPQ